MSAFGLKLCDLLEFSKMCAPEYNKPEFSDRVLVFDVMHDGWETTSQTLQNYAANELGRLNDTAEIANDKRNLVSTDEGPQKKRNKIEPSKSHENQVELPVADCGSEMENECDQTEGNQVEKPVISVVTDFDGIKANLIKPVRQHAIYIHCLWLAVQSPYFRSLLHSSGMKETHDREVHLKIPESEENSHLVFLEAMYRNDVLNDKTVDELLAVLELADKYDAKFLFKIAKNLLKEKATTFEISTPVMHFIKVKHNMNDVEDLATILQLVLAKEFSPLDENWKSEKFCSLPEPSVKYLLSSDDLIVQSENTVFHALMYWMEQNEVHPVSLEETNDLLAVVRFELVTPDYLYNVIKNHPTASKMPKFCELYLSGMTYHAIPLDQKTVLKVQPVLRKKAERKIVQHAFVIGQKDYKRSLNRKTKLLSEEFWACGYKMSVALIWKSQYRMFPRPCLSVHNLNKESVVHMKFAIFEQDGSDISMEERIFDSNACHHLFSSEIRLLFSGDEMKMLHIVVEPF